MGSGATDARYREQRYGQGTVVLGKRKRQNPPKLEIPSVPMAMVIRMFLIGSIAVGAAAWAIWRHYTVAPVRMVVPSPSASEIPAPEIVPAN